MREIAVPVEGMTCASCSARVERALHRLPGVREAHVNLATEKASMVYDEGVANLPVFLDAIREAGYGVPIEERRLRIEGMTCASCVSRVERALKAVPGVMEAQVNLADGSALVRYVPGLADGEAMARAVRDVGYGVGEEAGTAGEGGRERGLAAMRRDLWIAALFTAPVFFLAMGPMLIPSLARGLMDVAPFGQFWEWVQLFLASVVMLWPGRRFWEPGIKAYRHLSPDMNSLVLTGTGAAWLYSVVATAAPGILPVAARHTYFEAAAVVITVILFGRYLEELAKGRAGRALHRLAELQVRSARVLQSGEERELPVSEIVPGDMVLVRPGERVPVDGVVAGGTSHVDESMLTGEAMPQAKRPGDDLRAGTVNRDGLLHLEARRVGSDTVLAQMIRMVEGAQAAKLPIQGLADRVVAVFTPVVLAVAVIVFFLWGFLGPPPSLTLALVSAVAVLVVACPCAMGLATPAAIMVGTGRAAELGVLFRDGTALESLSGVDTVVFDKTGTLTLGKPVLTGIHPVAGWNAEEALGLAAAMESGSEHPLAHAIVDAAVERHLAVGRSEVFHAVAGKGVRGLVEGRQVLVGSSAFLAEAGVQMADAEESPLTAPGEGIVWLAVDGQPAAAFGINDMLRPEAPGVLARLRALGLETWMITGDRRAVAEAISGGAGIDHWRAEVLPLEKAELVAQLRREGRRVAFVGDGINDAPALATADVGLAMGGGTDIAKEAGQVILTGDLNGVAMAFAAARRTMGVIRGNLFWAFAYNILLIPLAAGAFYPSFGWQLNPMLAGLAMGFSSLFVMGNSLRLRRLGA